MATTRPFAYNLGSSIDGTEQLGNLAIGTPTSGFTQSPKFWNGPDEDLGYVITHQTPSGQPGADGTTAFLGFFRSTDLTEGSFITLSETIAGQTFATGSDAKIWLNNNGYWTSYQSNLIVYLDAGNSSSYPGTGTTWFDLEGAANNATLVNSPTFSSSYQGILQFDNASLQTANIPDLGNLPNWTIEAWVRFTTIPLSSFPYATAIITNTYSGGTQLNFSMGTNNAATNYNVNVGFFDGAWHNTTGFAPEANTWYQIVGTYDGATIRQYINGVASGGTLNYVGTPESGGEVRLMRRWDATPISGNYCDGDLAIVKIYDIALDAADVLSSYNATYTRFIEPTPTPTNTSSNTPTPTPTTTPTQTNTNTPTVSPTNTPTPSTSPVALTGYSFNLVALPYNFPSSGNSIMNSAGGITSGSTDMNVLATGGRGFYLNSIDSESVNRTNYYSVFTGQSVTITFYQAGITAIYSGDTDSFKYWQESPSNNGFVFGAGIGAPPTNVPSGNAVLIQSATTQFTIGVPVYVSLVINPGVTPTPSPTSTQTPTQTPTSSLTPSFTPTTTPTQTPTNTQTPTPTSTNTTNLQGFSYPNFASTDGITLVGAAAVSGGTIIALTTTTSASVGNMYRTTAIQYNRNFSAQWSSFIGGGTGADGYCVQWTTTNNTIGNSGGSVGRIETSSTINAIGFYTFTFNNLQWYKSNVLQSTTSVSAGFWRQQLYFWADYNNSAQTLALYYNTTNSKPGSPNITYSSFSFDTGSYYMGFGAATGGSNDNHEILSWSLQFT